MANFEVPIVRVVIEPHPNANHSDENVRVDSLEVAHVGGFQAIVGKDQFKTGDLAAYIPEGSLVPLDVQKMLGLEGRLAGANKNRVKAIKLRGVISQGILYPVSYYESLPPKPFIQTPDRVRHMVKEGDDVAELLGITKWIPEIPTHMAGDVYFAGFDKTVKYDIENWKRYPEVLDAIMEQGIHVVLSEKLHGTFTVFGLYRNEDGTFERLVSSKGMFGEGKAFKLDSPSNETNLYVRVANQLDIWTKLEKESMLSVLTLGQGVYIMGETFGTGVQSGFGYGHSTGHDNIGFRVFDILLTDNNTSTRRYLDAHEFDVELQFLGLESVPQLYRGPFTHEILAEHTDGTETVSGTHGHMREGVVITPIVEMKDDTLGRIKLKSVSAKYLLRKDKNATEYN